MNKPDLKQISAVILAAGQSKRMGQNKLLMPFCGQALLTRMLELVDALGFGEKILVVSRETARAVTIPESFITVINPFPGEGQASSVKLGLSAASLGYYMFFQADMPFLDENTVLSIISEAEEGKIIVPYAGEKPASPVIFHKKFRGELLKITGDAGGRAVIENYQADCKAVIFEDTQVFADVDTPEEYKKHHGF